VTLRCWSLTKVGQLLVDEPSGLAIPSLVCPFFTSCEAMEFAETGTGERSAQTCQIVC